MEPVQAVQYRGEPGVAAIPADERYLKTEPTGIMKNGSAVCEMERGLHRYLRLYLQADGCHPTCVVVMLTGWTPATRGPAVCQGSQELTDGIAVMRRWRCRQHGQADGTQWKKDSTASKPSPWNLNRTAGEQLAAARLKALEEKEGVDLTPGRCSSRIAIVLSRVLGQK